MVRFELVGTVITTGDQAPELPVEVARLASWTVGFRAEQVAPPLAEDVDPVPPCTTVAPHV
jgi:hypothetical protein